MAKVYSLPDEFENKIPEFDFKESFKVREEKENKFINELKEWAIKRNPSQENVGVVIKFPAADGYALYMVAATKPVQLIHLPLGDAWEFPYADRMTKKDIDEKVRSNKAIAEMFAKRQKEKGV